MDAAERERMVREIREQVNLAVDAAERGLAHAGEHTTCDFGGVRKVTDTDREVAVALNTVLEDIGRQLADPNLPDDGRIIGFSEASVAVTGELLARDLPMVAPSVSHSWLVDPDES